jgi:hypothetical protein
LNGYQGLLDEKEKSEVKTGTLSQDRKGIGTSSPTLCKGLAHTVLRVPRALLFAHVNNLADVVGIVGADVRKHLG